MNASSIHNGQPKRPESAEPPVAFIRIRSITYLRWIPCYCTWLILSVVLAALFAVIVYMLIPAYVEPMPFRGVKQLPEYIKPISYDIYLSVPGLHLDKITGTKFTGQIKALLDIVDKASWDVAKTVVLDGRDLELLAVNLTIVDNDEMLKPVAVVPISNAQYDDSTGYWTISTEELSEDVLSTARYLQLSVAFSGYMRPYRFGTVGGISHFSYADIYGVQHGALALGAAGVFPCWTGAQFPARFALESHRSKSLRILYIAQRMWSVYDTAGYMWDYFEPSNAMTAESFALALVGFLYKSDTLPNGVEAKVYNRPTYERSLPTGNLLAQSNVTLPRSGLDCNKAENAVVILPFCMPKAAELQQQEFCHLSFVCERLC